MSTLQEQLEAIEKRLKECLTGLRRDSHNLTYCVEADEDPASGINLVETGLVCIQILVKARCEIKMKISEINANKTD